MNQQELKEAIGRPQLSRLKALNEKVKVGKVLGSRVLVKTVTPETEMDRVEKEGRLVIPKAVKEQNTPMATTGVVLLVGPNVPCEECGHEGLVHQDGFICSTYRPMLQEGDMVMFSKFSGTDFRIETEDFRIMEASEIICTLVDVEGVLREVE